LNQQDNHTNSKMESWQNDNTVFYKKN
jgi:hypothetical protein